jgi:hypothetical protein
LVTKLEIIRDTDKTDSGISDISVTPCAWDLIQQVIIGVKARNFIEDKQNMCMVTIINMLPEFVVDCTAWMSSRIDLSLS